MLAPAHVLLRALSVPPSPDLIESDLGAPGRSSNTPVVIPELETGEEVSGEYLQSVDTARERIAAGCVRRLRPAMRDLNILIRTLEMNGREIRFRAGAGTIADSKPERRESRALARGMLAALNTTVPAA